MKLTTCAVFPRGASLIVNLMGPPDGFPVLLSHSLMMTGQSFRPLMERLAERGYYVASWDHYGQGSSLSLRKSFLPEVSLTRLTADAMAVIEQLNLRKPHFVGQGLGGKVALRLAGWRPELITSATVISASGEQEAGPRRAALEALADHFQDRMGGADNTIDLGGGRAPVAELLAEASFGAWTCRNNPALVEEWKLRWAALDRRIAPSIRAVADAESIIGELYRCDLPPVLAIAGAEDTVFRPEESEKVAHAAGGRAVVIEHAGHSVALEQPDVVLAHLQKFFIEAKAARSGTAGL